MNGGSRHHYWPSVLEISHNNQRMSSHGRHCFPNVSVFNWSRPSTLQLNDQRSHLLCNISNPILQNTNASVFVDPSCFFIWTGEIPLSAWPNTWARWEKALSLKSSPSLAGPWDHPWIGSITYISQDQHPWRLCSGTEGCYIWRWGQQSPLGTWSLFLFSCWEEEYHHHRGLLICMFQYLALFESTTLRKSWFECTREIFLCLGWDTLTLCILYGHSVANTLIFWRQINWPVKNQVSEPFLPEIFCLCVYCLFLGVLVVVLFL